MFDYARRIYGDNIRVELEFKVICTKKPAVFNAGSVLVL